MSWFVGLIGIFLIIISFPNIRGFIIARLFNEGLVTPRSVSPKKAELVKYAGPNLSLFLSGVVLIFLAIILRNP